MAEEQKCDAQKARAKADRSTSAELNPAWMRRHLSDSIYIWACGEKAHVDDEDLMLSDMIIGWLILLAQGFAYTILIVLARSTSDSDAGNASADKMDESGYLLPSVTGAMYLLVASTTHDVRAGFSLLVDGGCVAHRSFGMGLLIVFGVMISAAMTVLVSTSSDSTSVVLNAVTVLFIADLDEKAHKFLVAVPQKWRLFWALECIGASFVMALVAITYIGNASPLLEGYNGVLVEWPTWFVWMMNPAAVTMSSYLLSSALQAFCDFCSESFASIDEPTFRLTVRKTFVATLARIHQAKPWFKQQPFFYIAQGLWYAQMVPNWLYDRGHYRFPIAVMFSPGYDSGGRGENNSLVLTDNILPLIGLNVVLGIGLAMKALAAIPPIHKRVTDIQPESRCSSNEIEPTGRWNDCADSCLPSLLVGWGVGYWMTSLIYVLVSAWRGSQSGWKPPVVVTAISYVGIPCFHIAGIFMVADPNALGTTLGTFLRPAVEMLRNKRRVVYWIVASVFRDFLVLWIGYCFFLRAQLTSY